MTITEAAQQGITRLRLPDWSAATYLRVERRPDGLWCHVHSAGESHAFPLNGPYGIPCLKEWVACDQGEAV